MPHIAKMVLQDLWDGEGSTASIAGRALAKHDARHDIEHAVKLELR